MSEQQHSLAFPQTRQSKQSKEVGCLPGTLTNKKIYLPHPGIDLLSCHLYILLRQWGAKKSSTRVTIRRIYRVYKGSSMVCSRYHITARGKSGNILECSMHVV